MEEVVVTVELTLEDGGLKSIGKELLKEWVENQILTHGMLDPEDERRNIVAAECMEIRRLKKKPRKSARVRRDNHMQARFRALRGVIGRKQRLAAANFDDAQVYHDLLLLTKDLKQAAWYMFQWKYFKQAARENAADARRRLFELLDEEREYRNGT